MLFSDKMLEHRQRQCGDPKLRCEQGSVLNVDGLLGLSYWFNAASKLTLGYRADAYFNKSAPALNFTTPAQTIDHGPMIKFTIQK